jgi:hypothetical protein
VKLPNPARRFDYILEADRQTDNPTIWVLRRLTWEELAEFLAGAPFMPGDALQVAEISRAAAAEGRSLNDQEIQRVNERLPTGADFSLKLRRWYARALERALVEVRNVLDDDNRPLALPPAELLKLMPSAAIMELGGHLLQISTPEADSKNSVAPRAPGRAAETAVSAPGSQSIRADA